MRIDMSRWVTCTNDKWRRYAIKHLPCSVDGGRLNKLRIGPNLPNQMQEVADMGLTEFAAAVKKLITDVGPGEIRTGDWRRGVEPAPAGAEMTMYMK